MCQPCHRTHRLRPFPQSIHVPTMLMSTPISSVTTEHSWGHHHQQHLIIRIVLFFFFFILIYVFLRLSLSCSSSSFCQVRFAVLRNMAFVWRRPREATERTKETHASKICRGYFPHVTLENVVPASKNNRRRDRLRLLRSKHGFCPTQAA